MKQLANSSWQLAGKPKAWLQHAPFLKQGRAGSEYERKTEAKFVLLIGVLSVDQR
jgi:hypothetical protein